MRSAASDAHRVSGPAGGPPPVEAEGLAFGYGPETVLEDVDLTVGRGEFVALVGPNGSGKSTLLKLLLGLLQPERGGVRLFGAEPDDFRERWRLGYVPQRPALAGDLPASVEEVVALGRLSAGRRRDADTERALVHAIETVGLERLRGSRVRDLSVGQQQRVFIARALATRPDLLVLDEPIAGVDAESQERFRDALTHLVREDGASVLLVSHELGVVAEALDRVMVLKKRIVFDGPPSELVATGVHLGVHREDLPLWLEGLR